MKALIEIPDDELEEIDKLCKKRKISRTKFALLAMRELKKRWANHEVQKAFGLWKKNPVDPLRFQQKQREDDWE